MDKKEKNGEKKENIKNDTHIQDESPLIKMIYIILLYVFYLFGGLFNEKLTKTEYEYIDIDNNNTKKIFKFKYPSISLCFPSILSFVISSFMLKRMKEKYYKSKTESPITSQDKSIIGILHIISSFTAQTALIYIIYCSNCLNIFRFYCENYRKKL